VRQRPGVVACRRAVCMCEPRPRACGVARRSGLSHWGAVHSAPVSCAGAGVQHCGGLGERPSRDWGWSGGCLDGVCRCRARVPCVVFVGLYSTVLHVLMDASRLTDGIGNRTEGTVLFRFLGLRDRTRTNFLGSGSRSFRFSSRSFRFSSRFFVPSLT
jgi:hypothetical protein